MTDFDCLRLHNYQNPYMISKSIKEKIYECAKASGCLNSNIWYISGDPTIEEIRTYIYIWRDEIFNAQRNTFMIELTMHFSTRIEFEELIDSMNLKKDNSRILYVNFKAEDAKYKRTIRQDGLSCSSLI